MSKKANDYFRLEYEAWHKSYEIQFTHFMGVFYFWVAVVTFPATAGLIASQYQFPKPYFALLLCFLALIGFFLAAKMFDIRCSQLKYVRYMNEVRYHLYLEAKTELPDDYNPPFGRDFNARKVALRDFGLFMAIIMSAVNASYLCYAVYLISENIYISVSFSGYAWLLGFLTYFVFVWFKLRPSTNG